MADGGAVPDVLLTTVVRRSRVRASTISIKRLSKRELERGRMEFPESETTALYDRPKTRGDCQHGAHAERPCPFVSCKHHIYLDVADRGGLTLEEVGEIMNLTRERVRQLETRGIARLAHVAAMASLSDYLDEDPGT